MEKISQINYTFNYDGRTTSSFYSAYTYLIIVLENYNQEIPLEITFPLSSALSKEQKDTIDEAFIEHKRKPIFNKNLERKVA